MHSRVGRVLGAAVVVGVLVSGCGGPEQPGAAAVVGDTTVPLSDVQSRIGPLLAKVPADQRQQDTGASLARNLLTLQLVHGLTAQAAAAQGITIADQDIDTFIEEQGGLDSLLKGSLLDEGQLREQVQDYLISTELGRRAAPGLAVTVDILGATSRDDAEAKARTLAAGGPAADALFTDPRVSKRDVTLAAVTDAQDAASALFGIPQGAVVAFQPDAQQSTWQVARVTRRTTSGGSSAPAATSSLSQQELAGIGQRTLQPVADRLGVTVNPRYGVWDPIVLSVVPIGQTSGIIIAPPAAPAS